MLRGECHNNVVQDTTAGVLVETAMFQYKTIIGRKLQARTLSNQMTEAKIGCNVLSRMASSACRPPPGSADTRAGTGDATSSRPMHQRAATSQTRTHLLSGCGGTPKFPASLSDSKIRIGVSRSSCITHGTIMLKKRRLYLRCQLPRNDLGVAELAPAADEDTEHEAREEVCDRMHSIDIGREPRRGLRLTRPYAVLDAQSGERIGARAPSRRHQSTRYLREYIVGEAISGDMERSIAVRVRSLQSGAGFGFQAIDPHLLRLDRSVCVAAGMETLVNRI